MMENVLRGLDWQTCLVYLDDVLVFASDFQTLISRLVQVFQRTEESEP